MLDADLVLTADARATVPRSSAWSPRPCAAPSPCASSTGSLAAVDAAATWPVGDPAASGAPRWPSAAPARCAGWCPDVEADEVDDLGDPLPGPADRTFDRGSRPRSDGPLARPLADAAPACGRRVGVAAAADLPREPEHDRHRQRRSGDRTSRPAADRPGDRRRGARRAGPAARRPAADRQRELHLARRCSPRSARR